MQNIDVLVNKTALIFAAMLVLSLVSGCCTRSSRTPATGPAHELTDKRTSQNRSSFSSERNVEPKSENELQTSDPRLNEQRRRKTEQYKRLEYAHRMLMENNPQGSLREVERLQMDIREDPYFEMQTWYLSAMVYHKLGKPTRRKRSMRKMLETMEQLQKDARFRTAFEDGKFSQEAIQKAMNDAGEKYEKFAD